MDIQLTPESLVSDDKKIVVTEIKEVEIIKEVEKQVPVERVIERPFFVDKETVKIVTDVKTEQFYKLLADMSVQVEKTKTLVKESLEQIKYVASDPNKLNKIENLFSTQLKSQQDQINSFRSESLLNIDKLNQIIFSLKGTVEKLNIPQNKDYTGELSTIIRIIENLKTDLSTIRVDSIQQYLTFLKTSIDKINITPNVNVTTQKIEDVKTQSVVNTLSENIKLLHSEFLKNSKLLEEKFTRLQALFEKDFPLIQISNKDINNSIQKVKEEIPNLVTDRITKFKIEEKIEIYLTKVLQKELTGFQNELDSKFLGFDLKFSDFFTKSNLEFERVINQKIFDLSIQLQDIVSSLLKKELDNYLSTLKVELPQFENSEEVTLNLLGLIKQTIQNSIPKQSQTIVVDNWTDLKFLTGEVGQEAFVKKYGIFRRSKWFKYNGKSWMKL